MREVQARTPGLPGEDAQMAYVIGLDALAALHRRLASEGGLPLSWAIQGMLDAFTGHCQLDAQAREQVRARGASQDRALGVALPTPTQREA